MREGADVTIIACGLMVGERLEAAEQLAAEGIDAEVINMHTIKPIDADLIVSATKTGHVVTVEEHSVIGGLGSAVADVLCEQCPTPLKKIGVNDTFGESGSRGRAPAQVRPGRRQHRGDHQGVLGLRQGGSQGLFRQYYGNPAGALSWRAPLFQLR